MHTQESFAWVGKVGVNTVTLAFDEKVREMTNCYNKAWVEAGGDIKDLPLVGVSRHVVVAETKAKSRTLQIDGETRRWHRREKTCTFAAGASRFLPDHRTRIWDQDNQREVASMNTETALAQLGISIADLTPEQRRKFDEDGYFVVEDVFSPAEVQEMRSEFDRLRSIEGEFGGHEVHIEPGAPRLSNLFQVAGLRQVSVMQADTCCRRLSPWRDSGLFPQCPQPAQGGGALHSDVPRLTPTDWRVVNSMVMLDDMTPTNGPTRVVPGSHNWTPINVPDNNMGEVERVVGRPEDAADIPKDPYAPHPKEVRLTGTAGSVAVINGHIWHGGTRNESGASRQVLHLAIGRRDLPPQLNEREHLTPDLYVRTNPSQKFLLDIEGATPKVMGYPPLPTSARTWAAVETVVGDHH